MGKIKASIKELINTIEHVLDILAISETKITLNSTYDLLVQGYFMLQKDSDSKAVDVAIYLNKNLNYVECTDFTKPRLAID